MSASHTVLYVTCAIKLVFSLTANPIGIGVIYVIAPRIVNSDPTHQIPILVMMNHHLTLCSYCSLLALDMCYLSCYWIWSVVNVAVAR